MNATCSAETSPFATPRFTLALFHGLTAIGVPLNAFGAYCIIYKTPNRMRHLRVVLLLLSLSTSLLDVSLTFLGAPFIPLPCLVGFPMGILPYFGAPTPVATYIVISVAATVGCCNILLFEDRYNTLVAGRTWKILRVPFHVLNFTGASTFMLPQYAIYMPVDQKSSIAACPYFPCNQPIPETAFALSESPWYISGCIVFVAIYSVSTAIYFSASIHLNMKNQKNQSVNLKRLQQKLQTALILQCLIPISALVVPIVTLVVIFAFDIHNQGSFLSLVCTLASRCLHDCTKIDGKVFKNICILGFGVQAVVVVGACRLPKMRSPFGMLTINETVSQFSACFVTITFFFVGLVVQSRWVITHSNYFGNTSLILLPVILTASLLMSFNRFCASSMPFMYRNLFTKRTISVYIGLNWGLPTVCFSYFYIFHNCRFVFFQFGWVFMEALNDEKCSDVLLAMSISSELLIFALIMLLDLLTFIILITCRRKVFQSHSREHMKREINFASQAIYFIILLNFNSHRFIPAPPSPQTLFIVQLRESSEEEKKNPKKITFQNGHFRVQRRISTMDSVVLLGTTTEKERDGGDE
uniref:G_PROTEIN_RECEP_F1_2 domain-containing protein n=1 Tax=Caenorhabditis japonica TaxID=281687 RepID=A0A8R1DUE0_CAEJA